MTEERLHDGELFGIRLELVAICPKCGALVPINGLVPRVTCTSCGLVMDVSRRDWETILSPILERAAGLEPGFREKFSLDLSDYPLEVAWTLIDAPISVGSWDDLPFDSASAGPSDPLSEDAQRAFPASGGLEAGASVSSMSGSAVDVVSGVGRLHPGEPSALLSALEQAASPEVRRPSPDWAGLFPGLLALVGEDRAQFPVTGFDGPVADLEIRGMEEVAVCPGCGERLSLEDAGRVVACLGCGQESALPDSLWYRLHPVVQVRPWVMLLQRP